MRCPFSAITEVDISFTQYTPYWLLITKVNETGSQVLKETSDCKTTYILSIESEISGQKTSTSSFNLVKAKSFTWGSGSSKRASTPATMETKTLLAYQFESISINTNNVRLVQLFKKK